MIDTQDFIARCKSGDPGIEDVPDNQMAVAGGAEQYAQRLCLARLVACQRNVLIGKANQALR
ncbi:hypothetical protein [Xanthomonas campestris]|uniref:hypothetical protein n=1 Tax=Xanthomonas campestris TaxID=339 RepID=UPI000E1EA950|nr:hypothetical protein [Xanthomonas campestris]